MERSTRLRPLDAWRAIRTLVENPDDTAQAFRVVAALSGKSGERLYRRFRRSESGARILEERPELADTLTDLDRLGALPEETLGRSMADFFKREQLSVGGLEEAGAAAGSQASGEEIGEERRYFYNRLRDQHDVYHVVTGYGRDLRGEAAVLAFSGIQTRNFGIAFIPLYILFKAGFRSEIGKLIGHGFRRGWRARWVVDAEWEKLMLRPLDEVRELLALGPPPVYEAVRSEGAPQLESA
jgi:ubiquinone biosynthesis protein COQ4